MRKALAFVPPIEYAPANRGIGGDISVLIGATCVPSGAPETKLGLAGEVVTEAIDCGAVPELPPCGPNKPPASASPPAETRIRSAKSTRRINDNSAPTAKHCLRYPRRSQGQNYWFRCP